MSREIRLKKGLILYTTPPPSVDIFPYRNVHRVCQHLTWVTRSEDPTLAHSYTNFNRKMTVGGSSNLPEHVQIMIIIIGYKSGDFSLKVHHWVYITKMKMQPTANDFLSNNDPKFYASLNSRLAKTQFAKHLVKTKFGCPKIDNCGDTVMCSDDNVQRWQFDQFAACCMIIFCIRTHHCISTVINFESANFCRNLLHDPILPSINFNHIFYLIWHVMTTIRWYQIYVKC